MVTNPFIAWLSIILAVVGIVLFIRRLILWQRLKKQIASEPPPQMMGGFSAQQTILVISNGVQEGPFTRSEAITFANAGRFAEDAVYWEPGMLDWLPVKTLATVV